MKVINLYSGPSGGKSTTAAGLFYKMKLSGYKVELVTEYAKDLVYAGQLESMLEYQEVLFAEQNFRLQRLISHVDWAITDSPLMLSTIYPEMNQKLRGTSPWPALKAFNTFVESQVNTYDNVNIWLTRPTTYQEVGREHTLEQSLIIDAAIKQMFIDSKLQFQPFIVNEDVVDNILNWINNK